MFTVKIILMKGEKLGDTVKIRASDGTIHRYKVVRVDRSGLFPVGYLKEYPQDGVKSSWGLPI